jgi:hypothetical protein
MAASYDRRFDSRYVIIDKPKDRNGMYQVLEQDIRMLSSEIMRVVSDRFATDEKRKRLLYLEELLATYIQEQKKYE